MNVKPPTSGDAVSAAPAKPATTPRVLIVDDNQGYRDAFRRNLLIQGYEVTAAEDSDDAIAKLSENEIDVVVTDLSMRHATEGLDLIRQVRTLRPQVPVIMISAVGTFEEGAEATRLGARNVISKSKIDEEMENLFRAIDAAYKEYQANTGHARRLATLATQIAAENSSDAIAKYSTELRDLTRNPQASETIKGAAYDLLMELSAGDQMQRTQRDLDLARSSAPGGREMFERVDQNLRGAIERFADLDRETQETLRTAEFLYLHGEEVDRPVDFSRSIGFSYCFAVENEAKIRLRKKLQKLLSDPETPRLIRAMFEDKKPSLSIFFHQYLLRLQRGLSIELSVDNVYQALQRILEHGAKYKPDGLKALGIVLLCFGRNYSFKRFNQEVRVENPLGLRGLADDNEVLAFASLLINLQHYRNPYIHPEISEMEKLSKIRQTTFDGLNLLLKMN